MIRYLISLLCLFSFFSCELKAETICGQIQTEDNDPILKVNVKLKPCNGSQDYRSYTTQNDDKGYFVFENVAPGTYILTAEKKGWEKWEKEITVSDSDSEHRIDITLKLTFLYKMFTLINLSSLVYVAIFGLLVLLFNFAIATFPAKSVTLAGWLFILFSIVMAFIKQKIGIAFSITFFGVTGGLLIQWLGSKQASERGKKEKERLAEFEASQKEAVDKLSSLINKVGITLSDLKPYGNACFDGQNIEVKACKGAISKDTQVIIKAIEGGKPVVEVAP